MSSNPVEGRAKICQLKDLILALLGLIYKYSSLTSYVEARFFHVLVSHWEIQQVNEKC
jgi:hypothetical protein